LLPTTLTCTFSSMTGYAATNFPASATFTHTGGSTWQWTFNGPGCVGADLTLACGVSGWNISSGATRIGPIPTLAASGTCSPFLQVFNVPSSAYGCGTMGYTATFTV
jgi:hypothetical protein